MSFWVAVSGIVIVRRVDSSCESTDGEERRATSTMMMVVVGGCLELEEEVGREDGGESGVERKRSGGLRVRVDGGIHLGESIRRQQ